MIYYFTAHTLLELVTLYQNLTKRGKSTEKAYFKLCSLINSGDLAFDLNKITPVLIAYIVILNTDVNITILLLCYAQY